MRSLSPAMQAELRRWEQVRPASPPTPGDQVEAIRKAVEAAMQQLRPRDWFGVADAARHVGCGKHTVHRAIRRGELPARLISGRLIIAREDLERWVRAQPLYRGVTREDRPVSLEPHSHPASRARGGRGAHRGEVVGSTVGMTRSGPEPAATDAGPQGA